jgi:hypothetical protein
MIVGGAFSTWCWYRPLPKNAGLPVSTSVSTMPLPDGSGDAQGLVLPSIAEPGNAAIQTLRTTAVNELPPDLVGEGEVALQPYQENRHRELQDRVGTEPLPVIPIESPLVTLGRPNPKPPLWTNGLGPDPRSLMATQSAPRDPSSLQAAVEPDRDSPSPFRAGALAESGSRDPIASAPKAWPDDAYRSDFNRKIEFRSDRPSGSVASNATHNLPSFHQRDTRDATVESVMSLSSNRIRTEETERSIQSLLRHDAAVEPSSRQKSVGNVIRQPRSSTRP